MFEQISWEEVALKIEKELIPNIGVIPPFILPDFHTFEGRDCFLKTKDFTRFVRSYIEEDEEEVAEVLTAKPWWGYVLYVRLLFARDYALRNHRKGVEKIIGFPYDEIYKLAVDVWDSYGWQWLAIDRAGMPFNNANIDLDLCKVARQKMKEEQALYNFGAHFFID